MNKQFYLKKAEFVDIIAPNKKFIDKVAKSIILIKEVDYSQYIKLSSRLKMIFISRKSGYSNALHMPDKIWFTNYSMITRQNIAQLASILIHEGVHATQPANSYGLRAEREASAEQIKFLKKMEEDYSYVEDYLKNKGWNEITKDKKSSKHFKNILKLFKENKLSIVKIKSRRLKA